ALTGVGTRGEAEEAGDLGLLAGAQAYVAGVGDGVGDLESARRERVDGRVVLHVDVGDRDGRLDLTGDPEMDADADPLRHAARDAGDQEPGGRGAGRRRARGARRLIVDASAR